MLGIMSKLLWVAIYTIALSVTPVLLIRLPSPSVMVLITWKVQITLLIFAFLSFIEITRLKDRSASFKPMTTRKIFYILIAGFMHLLWLLGLLEACRNSIILHALLFNNLAVFLAPAVAFVLQRSLRCSGLVGLVVALSGI